MRNNKTLRGLRSVLATLAAATVATIGLAGTAMAAEVSTIDPDAKGSLNIHKYEGDPSQGQPNLNGTEQNVSGTPLEGAEFTLYSVKKDGFNLASNKGWQDLQTLVSDLGTPTQGNLEAAGFSVSQVDRGTTDSSGELSFKNLPVGLYFGVESKTPVGYQAVAPFLVTIPMTNPDGDGWNYDIHVYPKDRTGGEKRPEDQNSPKAGEEMTWVISANIPAEPASYLRVRDILDENLEYVSASVEMNGQAFAATDFNAEHSDQKVDITLTESGLEKINENPGGVVDFKIVTVVKEGFVGSLNNTGYIFNNENSTEADVTTPTVATKFAALDLTKIAAEDGKTLAGAEFEVYFAKSNDFSNATKLDVATLVTDADGKAELKGIRYSDFASGAQVEKGGEGYLYYWLKEVKAPSGYELLAEPVAFEITKDNTVDDIYELSVENVKRGAGIQLPFTGGPGTVLFIVAGVLLVAGATALTVRYIRR